MRGVLNMKERVALSVIVVIALAVVGLAFTGCAASGKEAAEGTIAIKAPWPAESQPAK